MGKKVDGAHESMIQGISQQAPSDRLPGQSELQENVSNNPEKGLLRRAPTSFIAELFTDAATYQFYNMEIDSVQYVVATKAGSIRIFTLTGVEQTVSLVGNAGDYLTSDKLSFLTLEGVTYISNPTVTVVMDSATKSYVQNSGIVFLLGGQYGRDYTVTMKLGVSTYTATHTTPDGSSVAHAAQIATTFIADALKTEMGVQGFPGTITLKSDVILLTQASQPDITVEDGDGGANIFAVTSSVGDIGRLPRFAPDGYVVKVTGAVNDYADDWYLQFTQEKPGFGNEGLWVETVAPDTEFIIDADTMPHTIVNTGSGTFDVTAGDWEDRRVGDTNTNPDPSFIGSTIQDMAAFQGRLVILAGPNVILSRTKNFTEFWLQSATTLADDDPIDVSSSAPKSAPVMRRAIPHNRDLVVFSDKAQFIVFGRNALTPSNTSLVLTTTYEAALTASPVASGKNVFYAVDFGQFTGVKEFFTEGESDINASRPVSAHCTRYIDGASTQMSTSTNYELLLVQTDTEPTILYAYEFLWINNEKVQSAWSKWVMPWDVLYTFFVENTIYFIRKIGNVISLDSMGMDRVWDTEFYQVHLDSKVETVVAAKIMTKPYDYTGMVYIQAAGCPNPGMPAKVESESASEVIFRRDMEGGTIISGIPYNSRFVPTRPIVRDRNGVPISTGALNVTYFELTFVDTGYITFTTSSDWYDDSVIEFSGRIFNDVNNLVGIPAISTDVFTIPFMHDVTQASLEISTDAHTPMRLIRLEWVGDWIKQGARI